MAKKPMDRVFVVVQVMSGVPISVEGFRCEEHAQQRANNMRRDVNPEDDEVGVFEVVISR